MTWLPLAVALERPGGQLTLLGSRHAARLRGAITGKNKSDVLDADVLARAGEVFELRPLVVAGPAQLALRRLVTRRGAAVIDANRHLRRLISLARWAFPDVWNGFGGSLPTAKAVLTRWPHLQAWAARPSSTAPRRAGASPLCRAGSLPPPHEPDSAHSSGTPIRAGVAVALASPLPGPARGGGERRAGWQPQPGVPRRSTPLVGSHRPPSAPRR
jgi:hypothetical protein